MEYWFGFIGDEYDFVSKARILNEWALAGWKFTGHVEREENAGNVYLMARELRVE